MNRRLYLSLAAAILAVAFAIAVLLPDVYNNPCAGISYCPYIRPVVQKREPLRIALVLSGLSTSAVVLAVGHLRARRNRI